MINIFKLCGIVMFICLMALLPSGCSHLFESNTIKSEQSIGPAEILMTPVDLFKGGGAKFQPFLGSMSGAFKLRYEGERPNARLDLDIWQDGKKTASSGSIGDLFFSSGDKENHEIEVIISMNTDSIEGHDEFMKIEVATVQDPGFSHVVFTIPWDKQLNAKGLIYHNEPRKFSRDEPAYLWGMQATSTNQIRTADFSPESLSGLEWALIFTLCVEDDQLMKD